MAPGEEGTENSEWGANLDSMVQVALWPEGGLPSPGLGSREEALGLFSPPFRSGWSYLFGFTAFLPGAPSAVKRILNKEL